MNELGMTSCEINGIDIRVLYIVVSVMNIVRTLLTNIAKIELSYKRKEVENTIYTLDGLIMHISLSLYS
jgi:hypothetical protein